MNRWRQAAAPIIEEVIRCCGDGCDESFVRKAISASYPFGEREYWPYKVWLRDVSRQLGKRFPKEAPRTPDPLQPELFGGAG